MTQEISNQNSSETLQQQQESVVFTNSTSVACDGSRGGVASSSLGHPKVFLHMKPNENQVICPYCSCKFILKTE